MKAVDTLKSWFGFPSSFSSTTRIDPRDEDGMIPFTWMLDNAPQFNDYASEKRKMEVVFSNPAMLKVFCLQCDLFSLGKIYVYKNEKEVKDDPILDMFKTPNVAQNQSQFLWDLMFYQMMGTAYCYVDSDIVSTDNKLYFLNPAGIEFPQYLKINQDKIVLSKAKEKSIQDTIVTYRYADRTSVDIPLSRLTIAYDLTNGTGNRFKSKSRIDAAYKIIDNSEKSLDAMNINLHLSGKVMIAGQADPKRTDQLPLGKEEKEDIESKANSRKQVFAMKSLVEVKRFVENMASLELGKSYLESYYLLGSLYGIPKDVLEAYQTGATYENQEKATAKHISYTLQPKGNDFFESMAKRFGYDVQGKSIIIDWSHLPFMQVMETDRSKAQKFKVDAFCLLLDQGVSLDEVNQYLDLDFKTGKANAKPTTAINTGTGNNA